MRGRLFILHILLQLFWQIKSIHIKDLRYFSSKNVQENDKLKEEFSFLLKIYLTTAEE